MVVRLALSTCLAATLLLSHAACSGGGSRSAGASKPIVTLPKLNSSKPKTTITKTDDVIVVQRGAQRTVILRDGAEDEIGN